MFFNITNSKVPIGSGAGAGLNFKVVSRMTQPSYPGKNTIWVKTDKMSGWIISPTQPEQSTEGMVWIKLSSSSLANIFSKML